MIEIGGVGLSQSKKPARRVTAENRHQDILNAALKVFSSKGFSGATTKEIASMAGVAEGTIFRYFKTKKDILFSLLGPYVVQSLADTIDAVSGETDEVMLTAILKNRLGLIQKHMDLLRLLITEAQFHPELRDKFAELIPMKAAAILEQFITQRIEDGAYRELNPQIVARALFGMAVIFVALKEFLNGDKFVRFDDDEIIRTIVSIFLYGVRK